MSPRLHNKNTIGTGKTIMESKTELGLKIHNARNKKTEQEINRANKHITNMIY